MGRILYLCIDLLCCSNSFNEICLFVSIANVRKHAFSDQSLSALGNFDDPLNACSMYFFTCPMEAKYAIAQRCPADLVFDKTSGYADFSVFDASKRSITLNDYQSYLFQTNVSTGKTFLPAVENDNHPCRPLHRQASQQWLSLQPLRHQLFRYWMTSLNSSSFSVLAEI